MLTALLAASLAQAPSTPPLVDADNGPAAQLPAPQGPPPPPAPPPEAPETPAPSATQFVPKLKFGVGSFQGFNTFLTNNTSGGAIGLLGGYLRLGWQQTERWGFELEGAATTIGFTSILRGAAYLNFTANDVITFSLGGALGTNREDIPNLFGGDPLTGSNGYAAAVGRIDFHFISSRNEQGARRAFDIGLMAEVGASDNGGPGGGLYLTMGFVYW